MRNLSVKLNSLHLLQLPGVNCFGEEPCRFCPECILLKSVNNAIDISGDISKFVGSKQPCPVCDPLVEMVILNFIPTCSTGDVLT